MCCRKQGSADNPDPDHDKPDATAFRASTACGCCAHAKRLLRVSAWLVHELRAISIGPLHHMHIYATGFAV
jgi:hypothetical protein